MSDSGERKKKANKLEKEIAKELGGLRVPASGAIDHLKGDISYGDFLIDSKNTEKTTIPFKLDDIIKIHREARDMGKLGHLLLTFINFDIHWAAVPEKYINFDLESFFIEDLVVKKQKSLSKSYLGSLKIKARKKGKDPAVRLTFEKVPLGVPNSWILIPFELYKEII